MRGKGDIKAAEGVLRRITPACAGKRGTDRHAGGNGRDHPRVCGEKIQTEKNIILKGGSPPRVRGKGIVVTVDGTVIRITPACAGKSPPACR